MSTPSEISDQIASMAFGTVMQLVDQFQTKRLKSDAVSAVMVTGYNLMRALEGDEFARGWLESALKDINTNPPPFVLRTQH